MMKRNIQTFSVGDEVIRNRGVSSSPFMRKGRIYKVEKIIKRPGLSDVLKLMGSDRLFNSNNFTVIKLAYVMVSETQYRTGLVQKFEEKL